MGLLDKVRKYFPRRDVSTTINGSHGPSSGIERIEVQPEGYIAHVYCKNGTVCRVRTEKALREAGLLD